MGINCSSIENVQESEYVKKLSSKETICEHDPFWNQLFSFTFKVPKSQDLNIRLEQLSEDLCRSLFENNQRNGVFGTLVRLFLTR